MNTNQPTSSGDWGVAPDFLSTVSIPLSPAPGFSMAFADIKLVLSVMPSALLLSLVRAVLVGKSRIHLHTQKYIG